LAVKRKALSATVVKSLRAKAKKSKLFNLTDLKKSYRRGQGAFLGAGSRSGVSMSTWAMARVNSMIRGTRKHDTDIRRAALKRRRRK
jgi:hypothetical protein